MWCKIKSAPNGGRYLAPFYFFFGPQDVLLEDTGRDPKKPGLYVVDRDPPLPSDRVNDSVRVLVPPGLLLVDFVLWIICDHLRLRWNYTAFAGTMLIASIKTQIG